MQFDLGDSEWRARWDNTLKYSMAYRLQGQDSAITDSPTAGGLYPNIQSQGDNNFDRGLVSNRLDVFSEFDLSTQNYGLRVSGAAWYDDIYNQDTDSDLQKDFLSETRKLHGRDAEILDAFVFVRGGIGESSQGTLRLGRHSLIYGESLFYGGNGIANAQGPIDVVKLLSVPGTQFKEILRPVNQVSGQLQINPQLSVGAYYHFEWERSNLPGAGSYLSDVDAIGEGSGSLFTVFGSETRHGKDIEAKDSGQGGMQLRYKPEGTELELGFYAAQYHDKAPSGLYLMCRPWPPTTRYSPKISRPSAPASPPPPGHSTSPARPRCAGTHHWSVTCRWWPPGWRRTTTTMRFMPRAKPRTSTCRPSTCYRLMSSGMAAR
jgi:hypothetical protein